MAIDAEESFDWQAPIRGTRYTTSCMRNIPDLHEIIGAYGVVPAYLLTYPILEDPDLVRILRREQECGNCVLGIQLHTWVTPPYGEDLDHRTSFAGNLQPGLEERKLVSLKRKFIECFGHDPLLYRGGRYGLGADTALLLEKHGFTVDTSIAPRTNFDREGGPDYSDFEYQLFWFGERRNILEAPLCRSVVGWSGSMASKLYRSANSPKSSPNLVLAALTRLHCAERITLSPEGNDFPAMRRLADGLAARGQNVLTLSFHSSSLEIGGSPYVQSRADLHAFYDRLSAILDYLASGLGVTFTDLQHLADHLLPPGDPPGAAALATVRGQEPAL